MKRSNKEYGGGVGNETFKSDYFRVVCWNMTHGIRTTIECKLSDFEIHFDGDICFDSDDKCLKELAPVEILEMLQCQKEIAFKAGQKNKAKEIRQVLLISNEC